MFSFWKFFQSIKVYVKKAVRCSERWLFLWIIRVIRINLSALEVCSFRTVWYGKLHWQNNLNAHLFRLGKQCLSWKGGKKKRWLSTWQRASLKIAFGLIYLKYAFTYIIYLRWWAGCNFLCKTSLGRNEKGGHINVNVFSAFSWGFHPIWFPVKEVRVHFLLRGSI